MIDFKKLLNRKEKSADDLARERLEREFKNNGWAFIGIPFCGLALMFVLPILFTSKSMAVKTVLGIVSVLLVAAIIFFAMIYMRQKNAMTGILEAFLAGERDISNIALGIGLNNKTTAKLIQTMILKKIIFDANIDRANNKIVDNKKVTGASENIGKIIICAGCGAKNTFTGKVGQRCEYCGAVISEDMLNENI